MDIQTAAQRLEQAISIARHRWPDIVERVSADGGVNYIRLYRAVARVSGLDAGMNDPTPDELLDLIKYQEKSNG